MLVLSLIEIALEAGVLLGFSRLSLGLGAAGTARAIFKDQEPFKSWNIVRVTKEADDPVGCAIHHTAKFYPKGELGQLIHALGPGEIVFMYLEPEQYMALYEKGQQLNRVLTEIQRLHEQKKGKQEELKRFMELEADMYRLVLVLQDHIRVFGN